MDPATKKFTTVSTCFPTHHVQFGFDADRTLWTSSGGVGAAVLGWVNTKMLEETGDEAKSQGWTPFVLDTNGNGKRDEFVEPNQPVDPAKDKRIRVGFYLIAPNPKDGSIWGTTTGFPAGGVVRVNPGSNPSETALAEIYEVPMPGYSPRGGDIDSQGIMYAALSSGHLGAFDRSKCKGPLNGPKAVAAVVAHAVNVQVVGSRRRVDPELHGLTPVDADPRRETLDLRRPRAADVPLTLGRAGQTILLLDCVRRRSTARVGSRGQDADT